MARLISFENYQSNTHLIRKGTGLSNYKNTNDKDSTVEPMDAQTVERTIELIQKNHPDRLMFNQKEVAQILGLSYSFINSCCTNNKINTVKFGNRQMVSIGELIRILIEGINDGNKKTKQ